MKEKLDMIVSNNEVILWFYISSVLAPMAQQISAIDELWANRFPSR